MATNSHFCSQRTNSCRPTWIHCKVVICMKLIHCIIRGKQQGMFPQALSLRFSIGQGFSNRLQPQIPPNIHLKKLFPHILNKTKIIGLRLTRKCCLSTSKFSEHFLRDGCFYTKVFSVYISTLGKGQIYRQLHIFVYKSSFFRKFFFSFTVSLY